MRFATQLLPVDLPIQLIMMDKELGSRNPSKTFYLRITLNDGNVDVVDLDGAVTPIDARKLAVGMGYTPTHWMEVKNTLPIQFY